MVRSVISNADGLAPAASPSSESLKELYAANISLDAENRELRRSIGELERIEQSRAIRYLHRIESELVRGNWADRRNFLREALLEARKVAGEVRHRLQPAPAPPAVPSGKGTDVLARLVRQDPERLKIAVTAFGGLGDSIALTAVIEGIKRKYLNSDIYVVVIHNPANIRVFDGNHYVRAAVHIEHADLHPFLTGLLTRNQLDIWFENKYVLESHYAPRARVAKAEQEHNERAFAPYASYVHRFPHGNSLLSRVAMEEGRGPYDLAASTAGLDLGDRQLFMYPSPDDFELRPLMRGLGDYITVHHGCDTHRDETHVESGRQTKNWFVSRWEEVIRRIKKETGLQVVQLGTDDEAPLRGAIHSFMGRTTVQQSAAILKQARFHLDTEGGLVHLARAVHTPSLVLFGPTPVQFFGYAGNVSVEAGDCHGCWWSTETWNRACPRGAAIAPCMDEISESQVVDAAKALWKRLDSDGRQTRYSMLDATLFNPRLLEEREPTLRDIYRSAGVTFTDGRHHAMQPQTGAYVHGSKNWEYLFVLDQIERFAGKSDLKILDVGAGRGLLSRYLADQKNESHIVDIDYRHAGPELEIPFLQSIEGRVKSRFGTAYNLPYDNDSFDVAVCVSVLEHLSQKDVVLAEMLRVVRPGGLVVLTYDLTFDHESSDRFDRPEAHIGAKRIEIFTEPAIVELMAQFGATYTPFGEPAVAASMDAIGRVQFEGIPPGLTVGGLSLRKERSA